MSTQTGHAERSGRRITLGDRRILAPGRLCWLRAMVWMVVLIPALAVILRFEMKQLHALVGGPSSPSSLLVPLLGGLTVLAFYTLAVRVGEARWPSEVRLLPAPAELLVGLAIGSAMFCVVMAILLSLSFDILTWQGLAPAWQSAGMAAVSGIVEEVLFRGVLLRLLWRAFGPLVAFALSSILFGAAHLANPGSTLFGALCIAIEAGLSAGALYALTGRLWASIGVHAGWNFIQGYLFGSAVSGTSAGAALAHTVATPGVDTLLNGGAFGPEASLPALLVCGVVGTAALWLAWRRGRLSVPPPG